MEMEMEREREREEREKTRWGERWRSVLAFGGCFCTCTLVL